MKALRLLACQFWALLWLPTGPALAQKPIPDSVTHRIILIGDAGRLIGEKSPVIDAVRAKFDLNNARTTLLYLGDNLYPRGLPDESSDSSDASVRVLQYQVAPALNKQANVLFIPGNHDWDKGGDKGWERIVRQNKWLQNINAPNIRMLPVDGCPGPEEIALTQDLTLIVLDTQWWLHPYEKPGRESDCACKTEDEVLNRLADILYRNRDKGVIVATHHPFRSYGPHGGYYTLKQHIFPFTDLSPNLYIPLPVLGTIYVASRSIFGNIQDLPHPIYKQMVQAIEKAASPYPNVVFVAGHDHNQQHIIDRNRNYIVSGAGINRSRVKQGRLSHFASPELGYTVLEQTQSGTLHAYVHTIDKNGYDSLAHTAALFRLPRPDQRMTVRTVSYQKWPDRIAVSIAPQYDSVGSLHRLLFGSNYRKEWATPVPFPVFDITREKGGMTILQRGGGQQTKSLRLKDSSGREWVLRTIQKDPESAVPGSLRHTVAQSIVQDQISAAYPFAPLTVPTLAEAAGVPHANPILVYVPDDPNLGIYRYDFAHTVCLLEERNPAIMDKSISTPKLLEALEADNDNRVDQAAVLRARMLDLLIGDWDRHEDQWRWIPRKTQQGTVFSPVPRDRDQVFFRPHGLFPRLAALPWVMPKFQGFRKKLPYVEGFMFNGRYFDRMFLNELSTDDWLNTITDLQRRVTDEIIETAISQLPDTIRGISGALIAETLKYRRDHLLEEGMVYYRFLSKTVEIAGSDKNEFYQIKHQNNNTELSVFKLARDNTVKEQLYYRVFDASVTRNINLYGRKGNDRFEVTGVPAPNITVRMIGGKGADQFEVSTSQPAKRHSIIYDLATEKNTLPDKRLAVLQTSSDPVINAYDPRTFQYDKLIPLATAGYNNDDGLLLGAGGLYIKQGFRKKPFASMNKLLVGHALATNAFFVNYEGQFTEAIGKFDLWLRASAKAPNNTTNFFGLGNETRFDKAEGRTIRYYRTRYNLTNVSAFLRRSVNKTIQITFGPLFQYYTLDTTNNRGRFISEYLQSTAERAMITGTQTFAGGHIGFIIDNRNQASFPSRGLYWASSLQGFQGLNNQSGHFTQLRSDLSLFTSFSTAAKFIIANRIGGGITLGTPAFYQLFYLGGQDNLRGYRNYRFAGQKMVYHNLELRLKLFDFASYIFPGSVGLLAFNDLGRVWLNGMNSQRWHHGYGGGFYIAPINRLVFSATVSRSKEETLPYISFGFRF